MIFCSDFVRFLAIRYNTNVRTVRFHVFFFVFVFRIANLVDLANILNNNVFYDVFLIYSYLNEAGTTRY